MSVSGGWTSYYDFIKNGFTPTYSYGSVFHLTSTQNIIVETSNSTHRYSDYSFKGSVYYIKGETKSGFTDNSGIYECNIFYFINSLDNFGGYGGVIYCYNCFSFSFGKPRFMFNFAFKGGLLFLDYDNTKV